VRQLVWMMAVLFGLAAGAAARGTPAGTDIANSAQIDYVVGGIDNNITSNEDTFVVDRIVDIKINWQDSAPVEVSAGDRDRVLTFRVTNKGNSDENITLEYEHNTSSDFLPENVHIVQDTNGNGRYDAGDTNLTRLELGADMNVTLFLVGDIPDDNTTTPGAQSCEILHADTERNATSGADQADRVDTVVRTGEDQDTGNWVIREYWLVVEKNATVHSEDNATHTGSRVTYTIDAFIDGKADGEQIDAVTIVDLIPEGTRYLPGSLRLDDSVLTDDADGDAGEANTTQVSVRMGTLSGTTHKTVQFDVEVE